MDFILVPLVVGIITLGIYKLFELYACRKERIMMIEKLGDKLSSGDIRSKLSVNLDFSRSRFSFGALRGACLMLGIGLGLLVAFLICVNAFRGYADDPWQYNNVASVVYGSCVLLLGGAGLLVSFFIEMKQGRKKEE